MGKVLSCVSIWGVDILEKNETKLANTGAGVIAFSY